MECITVFNFFYIDYAKVYVQAEKWNTTDPLWRSDYFRIYTSHCKTTKTENEIKDCFLEDYDFGEDLDKKYVVINDTNQPSKNDCSKMCEDHVNCTFSSWRANGGKCKILNGLKDGEWKRDNPPYFCKRNGATVTEKEVLCKPATQVIHESNGKD